MKRVVLGITIGMILLVTALGCARGPARTTRSYDEYGSMRADLVFMYAEQYFEAQKYREAIGKYQHYLDYYGDLYRADECQFRIGEAFDQLGEIPEAATAYSDVALNYPESDRAPEALLRAGKRYESVYLMEDAYAHYERCMDKYRYTPQATQARERAAYIAKEYLDMPVNFAWPFRRNPKNATPESRPNPQPALSQG